MANPKPVDLSAAELCIGLKNEFSRAITEDDIAAFACNSGDHNPLHVDEEYAKGTNYGCRLVHGAFQVGLASAMLGMRLPGRRALLGSVTARFPAPLYYPCSVSVRGTVTSWNPTRRSGQLSVVVLDEEKRVPTAEITMGFTLHEDREKQSEGTSASAKPSARASGKTVLVTGAAGGMGSVICSALREDYDVLAMVHKSDLPPELVDRDGITPVEADLTGSDWQERVRDSLGDRHLYGIVHAAWPGVPRGGLLDVEDDVLGMQLDFGALSTVHLARFLFERPHEEGGRLVGLGSIFGHAKPVLSISAYSLGKGVLEDTVRLLAPELARKTITINAICPSFVHVGMNKMAMELELKRQAAQVPMGRLCETPDVVGAVRYLLSPEASFISGQSFTLSGGQL